MKEIIGYDKKYLVTGYDIENMILLTNIEYLCTENKGCWKSDAAFGEMVLIGRQMTNKRIRFLKDEGWFKINTTNIKGGKKRILEWCNKELLQVSPSTIVDIQQVSPSTIDNSLPVDNSIDNSIDNITPDITPDINKDVKMQKLEKSANAGPISGPLAKVEVNNSQQELINFYKGNYIIIEPRIKNMLPTVELFISWVEAKEKDKLNSVAKEWFNRDTRKRFFSLIELI